MCLLDSTSRRIMSRINFFMYQWLLLWLAQSLCCPLANSPSLGHRLFQRHQTSPISSFMYTVWYYSNMRTGYNTASYLLLLFEEVVCRSADPMALSPIPIIVVFSIKPVDQSFIPLLFLFLLLSLVALDGELEASFFFLSDVWFSEDPGDLLGRVEEGRRIYCLVFLDPPGVKEGLLRGNWKKKKTTTKKQ